MPTNLPMARGRNVDTTAGWKALLHFYCSVGLVVAVLIAGEIHLGMFAELTAGESVLKATGLLPDAGGSLGAR